jgi:hypothetical protein
MASETEKILKDKKLMRAIRKARKNGSKSSPYIPLTTDDDFESELNKNAKTPFQIWQETVEQAHKNLPNIHTAGELSKEADKIRQQKDWIHVDVAVAKHKKAIEEITDKLAKKLCKDQFVKQLKKNIDELLTMIQETLKKFGELVGNV